MKPEDVQKLAMAAFDDKDIAARFYRDAAMRKIETMPLPNPKEGP